MNLCSLKGFSIVLKLALAEMLNGLWNQVEPDLPIVNDSFLSMYVPGSSIWF
jgi:hypothetical protein